MTFEEIELQASKGNDPPGNLGDEEKCCWYAMRGLYALFYAQKISREIAKEQKKEIASCFRNLQYDRDKHFVSCAQYMENIRNASKHKYELVKAKTTEEALDLALKVISDMLGEDMTEKAIKRNLGLEDN